MRTKPFNTLPITRSLILAIMIAWFGHAMATEIGLDAPLTGQQKEQDIRLSGLAYWVDSTGDATLADAQKNIAAFTSLNSHRVDQGLLKGAVWLSLPMTIDSPSTEQEFFVLNKVHLRKVDFYQLQKESSASQKLLKHTSTGTDKPFASRELAVPHWAFNIRQVTGEHLLLVRLETRSPLQANVSIESTRDVVSNSHQYTLGYAIILGCLVFTCLISVVIARTIKQTSMWLGCLLMSSVLLEILSSSGLGFEHLWPNYPEMNPVIARMSIALALGSTALFCVEFLKAQAFAPHLAKATQSTSVLLIGSMLFPMPSIAPLYISFIIFLVTALTISVAILAYRRNAAGAPLILFGIGFFLASVFASVLLAHRIFPASLDYGKVYDTGLLFMALLLTYGLIRRISEDALDSAVNRESIKAKTLFFATVSHEIRTPINGIIGMLNLMLKDNLNEPQQRLGKYARSSAESLLHLINDILDFSKIEAGKLDIELIEFDVVSLLEEIVDSFACVESNQSLELILDTSQIEDLYIKSDPGRLRQILNNLISNAIKFTEIGQVEIKAKLWHDNHLPMLKISIRDSGIGLSAEQLSRLFKSFSQADHSTTRKYGGTGLGLSIAKQLCELLGGNIQATSRLGIGSTFTFNIHVEKMPHRFNIQQPDIAADKAVIYAPNPRVTRTTKRYLEGWGAKVTVANSHQDFSKLVSAKHAKIAIFDGAPDQLDHQPQFLVTTESSPSVDSKVITKPLTSHKLKRALISHPRSTKENESISESKPNSKATKLLLVEDNFINTEVALGILEDHGYLNVTHAENGKEALNLLCHEEFDLVLMDCQMPVLDGYETTQSIRAGKSGAQSCIPVIAMTANAMRGDRERCLAAGMNDYLTKPIDPIKLSKTLNTWLT